MVQVQVLTVIACLPSAVALVGAVGVMPDAGPMAGHFCELKFRLSLQRASFSSSFKYMIAELQYVQWK